jgi:hypothetical protein
MFVHLPSERYRFDFTNCFHGERREQDKGAKGTKETVNVYEG